MRRFLFLALLSIWLALPVSAQTVDSVVCKSCVVAKVDSSQILVKIDTVPIQVRIDSTYALKVDTTYRDSTVPVPAPGPSLPSGVALVSVNGCSTVTDGGWVYYAPDKFAMRTVTDPQRGPVCSADFTGQKPGSGPGGISRTVTGGTLYLSGWFRLSPGWVNHTSNLTKIWHVWIAGLNRVYIGVVGAPNGALHLEVRLQQVVGGSRNLKPNRSAGLLPRGQWVFLELKMTADGAFTWSIDHVLAGEYQTTFLTSTQLHRWEKIQWDPTWGGTGCCNAPAQDMELDDVVVAAGP